MQKPPGNLKDILKKTRYAIEFGLLVLVIGGVNAFSPNKASDLAGKLGRKIGPRMAASRKAMANLKMALPGKTDDEYKAIIAGMWDNLARVLSEYPNLETFAPEVEMIGVDIVKAALERHEHAIMFSGHLGNWEMMATTLSYYEVDIDLVYRAPNNPWVDRLLNHYRSLKGRLVTIPKSKSGMRRIFERLKEKNTVGILIDQKYNEGVAVPFFGHPAMTSPAFVQLAQRFNCPLIPARIERLKGTNFRMTFHEEIPTKDANGQDLPVEDVIAKAHALLESWITERPEQWLWLHRRWIDQKNPGKKAATKMSQPRKPLPRKPSA